MPEAATETEAGTAAKGGSEVDMQEREEGQRHGRVEAQGSGRNGRPAPQVAEEPFRAGSKGISNGYVAGPTAIESEQRGMSGVK